MVGMEVSTRREKGEEEEGERGLLCDKFEICSLVSSFIYCFLTGFNRFLVFTLFEVDSCNTSKGRGKREVSFLVLPHFDPQDVALERGSERVEYELTCQVVQVGRILIGFVCFDVELFSLFKVSLFVSCVALLF